MQNIYKYICPKKKYTPDKSLKAPKTESPWANEKRIIITSENEVNLSLLQKIHKPKKIKPKNIGVTPSKYLITLGREFLIIT